MTEDFSSILLDKSLKCAYNIHQYRFKCFDREGRTISPFQRTAGWCEAVRALFLKSPLSRLLNSFCSKQIRIPTVKGERVV